MKKTILLLITALFLFASNQNLPAAENGKIQWQGWTDNLFETAQKEKKLVILDLEAVWCHWCHVMEEKTYRNPKVVEIIQSKYIPVRVDQDSRPDLSNRYEDYGWPATIIFSSEGKELAKLRGYIEPERMAKLLDAFVKDPTPGPSARSLVEFKPASSTALGPKQKEQAETMQNVLYDKENGGWGRGHKLILSDNLEYALVKAQAGDKKEEARARQTLDNALNLLDPEWGGFYQYSDQDNWKSPHFEKIMSIQAQYIRLYTLANAYFSKPEYLNAAKQTARYLKEFLSSPDGAFYTSQDADVSADLDGHKFYPLKSAARRKIGRMPRVDKNIYARENGWAISALATLYSYTGEQEYLDEALRAARWIIKNESLPGGGFSHSGKGPFLGDTLSMGQAFLNLYEVTGDRAWLAPAVQAAEFIEATFADPQGGGFITRVTPKNLTGVFQKPVKQLDENVAVARFATRLFYYSGNEKFKKMAGEAMRYLASPDLVDNTSYLSGVLLADSELSTEPVHITVVGSKKDPKAKELFLAALRYPATYRRVEWWDKKEGPLPNADVTYPDLPKAAAFSCAGTTCSFPVFEPGEIADQVNRARRG